MQFRTWLVAVALGSIAPLASRAQEVVAAGAANGVEPSNQNAYLFFGDGYAQWAMAITGLFAFLLSAWAVWLVNKTLKETRVATDAARSGADAAAEANRILLRDMRPWVDFTITSGALTSAKTKDGAPNVKIHLEIEAENFGRSPATEVFTLSGVVVTNRIFPDRTIYQEFIAPRVIQRKTSGSAVFPGAKSGDIEQWFRPLARKVPEPTEERAPVEMWNLVVCLLYRGVGDDLYFTCKTFDTSPPHGYYEKPTMIMTSDDAGKNGRIGKPSNQVYG